MISIEELDRNLTRVEWTTDLIYDSKDILKQQFELGRYHPNAPLLEVTCVYKLCDDPNDPIVSDSESDDRDYEDDASEFKMTIYFEQAKMSVPAISYNSGGIFEDDGISQHRPSAVYANVNRGGIYSPRKSELTKQPLRMKESASSPVIGKWTLEKFNISIRPRSKRSACGKKLFPFDCIMWIQFPTTATKTVVNQISEMYFQQNNCDVHFCFVQQLRVGGHKSILASRSPVFAAMFEDQMMTDLVEIQDIELDIFKELLYFIYSGRFSGPLNKEKVFLLINAAKKFKISGLEIECAEFLFKSMSMSDVIKGLIWSHQQSNDLFKKTALLLIERDGGKKICQLQEWEDLTKNHPDLCLLATRHMMK